jgi:hypothetical protein
MKYTESLMLDFLFRQTIETFVSQAVKSSLQSLAVANDTLRSVESRLVQTQSLNDDVISGFNLSSQMSAVADVARKINSTPIAADDISAIYSTARNCRLQAEQVANVTETAKYESCSIVSQLTLVAVGFRQSFEYG